MVARLAVAFAAMTLAVVATGGSPSIKAEVITLVARCAMVAVVMVCWESRQSGRATAQVWLGGTLAGLAALWINRWPMVWPVVAVLSAALAAPTLDRTSVRRIGQVILAALFGFGAVWNANVLAARLAAGRLKDDWFRAADLLVYNSVGVGDGTYAALFPLIDVSPLVQGLSQSYLLLLPELFVALVLTAWRRQDDADRLLALIFGSYGVGLMCFLVVPAVGPCIAFPDSVNMAALPVDTQLIMNGMAAGFRSATSGTRQPVVAYFVAMPSLHVLLALILQRALRPFPVAAAVFTPVNGLVVLSTFVLGLHYLLDIVAAFVLFPVMLLLCEERRRPVTSAAAL